MDADKKEKHLTQLYCSMLPLAYHVDLTNTHLLYILIGNTESL